MQTLVVHAHPDPDSYSAALRDAAVAGLRAGGHDVEVIGLYEDHFAPSMTARERRDYESDHAPTDPQLARYAELVRTSEALVFVYPTWWFGLPAILKGWLDRVLVPGVAFHLDPRNRKVRSDLRHVRRVAGITTSGSSRLHLRFFGDTGSWTVRRTLRVLCAPRCRTRWLHLGSLEATTPEERQRFLRRVESKMAQL